MSDESTLKITARWPHLPKVGEKDIAEIGVRVGARVLTQLLEIDSDQKRDFIRASAVSLALWCADNWWRLRWEPIPDYRSVTADWRLRHELTSASGGTTWPPVMIYGVGDRVVVGPIAAAAETGGRIEYLPIIVSVIAGPSFEGGLDDFFQTVVRRCARAQDGSALNEVINQLNAERSNPELAAWRRLEARLGFDPDTAPDGVMENLSQQEKRVGVDAVEEAAMGCPGVRAPEALQEAITASEASEVRVDLSAAAAEARDYTDLTRPTWAIAEDAAAHLRSAVGRPDGPLHNHALSEILETSWDNVKGAAATASKLPYGARLRVKGTTQRVALQTRTAHDRRFELARTLGDEVWSKNAELGIISRAKTDRQKFQRAFAQSLLCPFADLRNEVDLTGPTDAQIEVAAHRYHVHRSVVRTLLVNKGILPRETLGERLEAA